MLNKGITVSSVTSYFRSTRPQSVAQGPTQQDITNALEPLFNYFNENFAIMKQTLTDPAMIMVMTRLWKEVLATIESLLVPPLSDKPSQQRPLTQQELDIVFKWLRVRALDLMYITNVLTYPAPVRLLPRRRRRGQLRRRPNGYPQVPKVPRTSEPQLFLL